MLKVEERLLGFVRRYVLHIFLAVAVIAALGIRFAVRGFVSGDMQDYLMPWLAALREGGLTGVMALPNYDYNMAYVLLLWPFSFLPLPGVVVVKLVSTLFDILLAFAMAWVLGLLLPKAANKRLMQAAAFAGTLLLPLVMANSALWGQCDSIYTTFLLVCIGLLLQERYTPAFSFFALALAFKLQAVFFLPVLIVLYCTRRRFSVLQFLQAPVLVFLLGLAGRGPGDSVFNGFLIYFRQTQTYPALYADYPNFWIGFSGAEYGSFAVAGILFCLGVFAAVWAYCLLKGFRFEGDSLILLAAWVVMTCCVLLPAMHDRYAYPAEVLVWLFFLARPGLKRLALALSVNFIPMLVYVRALFEWGFMEQGAMARWNMLVWLAFTVYTWYYVKQSHVGIAIEN